MHAERDVKRGGKIHVKRLIERYKVVRERGEKEGQEVQREAGERRRERERER